MWITIELTFELSSNIIIIHRTFNWTLFRINRCILCIWGSTWCRDGKEKILPNFLQSINLPPVFLAYFFSKFLKCHQYTRSLQRAIYIYLICNSYLIISNNTVPETFYLYFLIFACVQDVFIVQNDALSAPLKACSSFAKSYTVCSVCAQQSLSACSVFALYLTYNCMTDSTYFSLYKGNFIYFVDYLRIAVNKMTPFKKMIHRISSMNW